MNHRTANCAVAVVNLRRQSLSQDDCLVVPRNKLRGIGQ